MNNSDTRRELQWEQKFLMPKQRCADSCLEQNDRSILKHAFASVLSVFSTGLIFRREKRREVYSMRDCNIDISVYRSGCEHLMTSLFSLKSPLTWEIARQSYFEGTSRDCSRFHRIRTNKTCTVSFAWLVALFSDFEDQKLGLIQCIPHNGKGW